VFTGRSRCELHRCSNGPELSDYYVLYGSFSSTPDLQPSIIKLSIRAPMSCDERWDADGAASELMSYEVRITTARTLSRYNTLHKRFSLYADGYEWAPCIAESQTIVSRVLPCSHD
jgi:hypothetical protein